MYNDDIKFITYIESMEEDIKFPENLPKEVEDYFRSNPMPDGVQGYLFPILNKNNEELEREKIHELENDITRSVSAMSVKDFKKLINKVKKNSKELGLSFSKPNEKDVIKVIFRDNSLNVIEITFRFADYVDKSVTKFISPSFRY